MRWEWGGHGLAAAHDSPSSATYCPPMPGVRGGQTWAGHAARSPGPGPGEASREAPGGAGPGVRVGRRRRAGWCGPRALRTFHRALAPGRPGSPRGPGSANA